LFPRFKSSMTIESAIMVASADRDNATITC